jgi:cyanophycinase-like exopeptidase
MSSPRFRIASVFLILFLCCDLSPSASYKYIRIGNQSDVQTTPVAGTAMMGGGSDLDEAFRWLCNKGNGGDFVVLRAHGDDDYNSYINGLCKANSVATLIIPDRAAAEDPAVAEIIRRAEIVFIAGGDQANYIKFWKGTPVEDAINADVAAGKPIGGTSAGLAVQGEFLYGALNDPADNELHSKDALANPYHYEVTVVTDFLKIPHLDNLITDSHFAKRDRMGRTLVFLARMIEDGQTKHPREVAIDEKSAVLVDAAGQCIVVGPGKGAYFLRPTHAPEICKENIPLEFHDVAAYHVPRGGGFDLNTWTGDGGVSYSLSVEKGIVHSRGAKNEIY